LTYPALQYRQYRRGQAIHYIINSSLTTTYHDSHRSPGGGVYVTVENGRPLTHGMLMKDAPTCSGFMMHTYFDLMLMKHALL
jgi:hypothetical protein